MPLNSNAIQKKYYCDGHYRILVLIKNLKLASVLQMLSRVFRSFGIFFFLIHIYILSVHSKREFFFDNFRFLLLGGPLNVIGVLKFVV